VQIAVVSAAQNAAAVVAPLVPPVPLEPPLLELLVLVLELLVLELLALELLALELLEAELEAELDPPVVLEAAVALELDWFPTSSLLLQPASASPSTTPTALPNRMSNSRM
jgi:hypothetical protein